jgi:hypothetical protein
MENLVALRDGTAEGGKSGIMFDEIKKVLPILAFGAILVTFLPSPTGLNSYLHRFPSEPSESETHEEHGGQTFMQIVLSLATSAVSLFVILAKRYGPKDKHWAYATIGMILGFWLHSK